MLALRAAAMRSGCAFAGIGAGFPDACTCASGAKSFGLVGLPRVESENVSGDWGAPERSSAGIVRTGADRYISARLSFFCGGLDVTVRH